MLPDITKKTEDKIRKTIEEKGLIVPKQHIVIGLSGGPDSVCLFNALKNMADRLQLTIHPVHVNHKFRPGAAEQDQKYVEELCERSGLTCHSFVVDCNELAAKTGMTSEEAGRKARYDAFYEVAEEVRRNDPSISREDIRIAVAQNANDQAETVLFRLLRGTGVDGLAGIAYEREERGYKVIRPILDLYRDEIEDYCEYNELQPVIDHTNEESVYARNKIRNELIPYLEKEHNTNLKESMVRLARIAAADKEYLWHQTEETYRQLACEGSGVVSMDREALAKLHPAIRHRVMLKAFAAIGLDSDVSEERIKAADHNIEKKQGPKTVQFPKGYVLEVAKGKVMMKKA
ncbi:MAG: tRNA lysidine(34) synthetase TilS [Firmicutes bacterium]|nr:tRNA lysidine(34) synthetase TilS [Bacillota bacterium]